MKSEKKSVRSEKAQMVQDLQSLVEPAECLLLTSYSGLSVRGFEELRGALCEAEGECHVVPNRLLKRVLIECGIEGLTDDVLTGDTAMVTGSDPAALAKRVRDFGRAHNAVAFKAAVVGGSVLSAAEAGRLADLPSKEVLQAQLLGLLQAPAGQLVGVLNAKVASVVYVLSAYLREKEKAA